MVVNSPDKVKCKTCVYRKLPLNSVTCQKCIFRKNSPNYKEDVTITTSKLEEYTISKYPEFASDDEINSRIESIYNTEDY